jgi:hypothetical protein
MKSNVIFVKIHTRLQSTDFVLVVVLVLVLRPLRNSDFEHEDEDEDEYEKNQIKSHAYALVPSTLYYADRMKLQFLFQLDRPLFFGRRRG